MFLHKCRVGVLQYVAVQCFCAVAGFVLQRWFRSFYHEGSMSPRHGPRAQMIETCTHYDAMTV